MTTARVISLDNSLSARLSKRLSNRLLARVQARQAGHVKGSAFARRRALRGAMSGSVTGAAKALTRSGLAALFGPHRRSGRTQPLGTQRGTRLGAFILALVVTVGLALAVNLIATQEGGMATLALAAPGFTQS